MPRKFYESFNYAMRGVRFSVRSQRNILIHLTMAAAALALAAWLRVSLIELAVIVVVISSVIVLELINTAMEEIVNMLSITRKMRAMYAKDVSAAAVLVSAFAALAVGFIIFAPKLAALVR